jgi:L-lactate dehydrogenase complex protein LldF
LENRKEAVDEKHSSIAERTAWKLWKTAMLNRKIMNIANGKTKSFVVNGLVKDWKKNRAGLQFPQQSFSQQWQQNKKK